MRCDRLRVRALVRFGEPSQGCHRGHERLEQVAMRLELLKEELAPGDDGATTVSLRGEILTGRLVLEQVENPDVRGDGLAADFLLEVRLQLLLPEVLLKG